MKPLKVRLVKVIDHRIMVHFKGGKESIEFKRSIDGKYNVDEISKAHPDWIGCGSWPVYDTEDGELHPGDMFWHYNYKGVDHLHLVLPNGIHWDIDSRASNCTLPEDNEHKCWVRHGEPPEITVDKKGLTCSAGAGSIQAGDFHGYLIRGYIVENESDLNQL